MSKTILVINREKYNDCVVDLLAEINNAGYDFYYLAPSLRYKKYLIEEKEIDRKKIFYLPFLYMNLKNIMLILFPFWICLYAILFFVIIKRIKCEVIIPISRAEKIIFSILARIFKVKALWLSLPGHYPASDGWVAKKLSLLASRKAKIIVFSSANQKQLINYGFFKFNIEMVLPGIKPTKLMRQDDIYSELAESENKELKRKYFTIGTILSETQTDNIEVLCQAIKECLAVIPNLQLIVIGDNDKKQKLNWLTKKLEIDNVIWFIGRPKHLGKWLSSFDVFISIIRDIDIEDLLTVIRATAFGLPIIALRGAGFEDAVKDNQNGILLDNESAENLARNIISLEQNTLLRKRYAKKSREVATEYFQLENTARKFVEIL